MAALGTCQDMSLGTEAVSPVNATEWFRVACDNARAWHLRSSVSRALEASCTSRRGPQSGLRLRVSSTQTSTAGSIWCEHLSGRWDRSTNPPGPWASYQRNHRCTAWRDTPKRCALTRQGRDAFRRDQRFAGQEWFGASQEYRSVPPQHCGLLDPMLTSKHQRRFESRRHPL